MNSKQITALRRLTNNVEYYNRLLDGTPLNGVMVWKVVGEPFAKGEIMVSGVNEDLKFFHSAIHVIALVGPRGGIKVKLCTGLKPKYII